MKKHLSIFLSLVILLSSLIFPLTNISAESTDADYLNNAENWATYNSSNVKNGWWGAPVATEKDGKAAIKVNSMSLLATATKINLEKNTKYSLSFEYCGSVLNKKALSTVGVATLTNGEVTFKNTGDIYNSGNIGDTTDWSTVTFEFDSGENTQLELFILPAASSSDYAENPLYLANFNITKIVTESDANYLNNAENWATYNSSNVKNGWWGAPVATEKDGKAAIKVNSMSLLATATKINLEKNTKYSLSFEYCGSVLNKKALSTVGIATLTNGEVTFKNTGDIYNSGNIGDTTDWSTVTFEFDSGENTQLELFILPAASSSDYAENPLYLANFTINKVVEPPKPPVVTVTPDNYFETPENWDVSVNNSSTRPSKNILIEGISDTTVATGEEVITWAKFTNDKTVTSTDSGSSLLVNNPHQTSFIKLPNIETGASYRVKFAYKPIGGSADSSVLRYVGIFDPEFTQSKITADSSLTYSNLKTGFIAVDAYTVLNAGRYRFENGVYEKDCIYGKVNDNSYNETDWRYSEIYFTAKDGLDNLYLLISYTTEAGKLYVDGFEFEKVSAIPENQIPGALIPSDAPTLDENGYRKIDMEKDGIIKSDAAFIKRLPNGGYDDNGATLYLPEYDHTVTENPTKVTALNFGAIHQNRNDPYFKTAVNPLTEYSVTVRVKKTTEVETTEKLLLYGDWYGYYDNKNPGTSAAINYSSLPLNEWTEYSFRFVTAAKQNEIAFYFNAGAKYPELYIDQVEISQKQPLYTKPQNTTVLDFDCDPGYYSHIKNSHINFEKVEGPDGNISTAMHFKERPQTADQNVTFTSFNTVLTMQDPYLTIPVEPNAIYKFSFFLKVNDSKANFVAAKAIFFADFRGRGVTGNGISQSHFYRDILGTDWTKYTVEFFTLPGQTTATFAVNAFYCHPEMWIDNVTYEKIPAGATGSTELSYCEDEYNLTAAGKNGTFKSNSVIKVELAQNNQYTYGFNLSGKGKVTVAFDPEGTDLLKTYDLSKIKGRIGETLITDAEKTNLFIIFEPDEGGITYKDLCVFERFSIVGAAFEMGYTENINNLAPIKFSNIPTVVGDEWDAVLNDTANSDSPSTGEKLLPISIILLSFILSAFALIFTKTKKNSVN